MFIVEKLKTIEKHWKKVKNTHTAAVQNCKYLGWD